MGLLDLMVPGRDDVTSRALSGETGPRDWGDQVRI